MVKYTLNRFWSDSSWFEHLLITEDIPMVRVGNGTQTSWIWFLAWLQVFLHTWEQITLSVLCCGLVAKESKPHAAFFKSEALQVGELTCHSCPHPKAKAELNICWGDYKLVILNCLHSKAKNVVDKFTVFSCFVCWITLFLKVDRKWWNYLTDFYSKVAKGSSFTHLSCFSCPGSAQSSSQKSKNYHISEYPWKWEELYRQKA